MNTEALKRLVLDSGISFKQTASSWIFTCPRCNKAGKLYLYKESGRFLCFICSETENFKGRPEYALTELLGIPIGEIRSRLYGDGEYGNTVHLDLTLRDFDNEVVPKVDVEEQNASFDEVEWPWEYFPIDTDKEAKRGREYLEGRGISLSVAMEYDIRYAPTRRRVAFPVIVGGRLLGYQERLVVPHRNWNEEQGRYNETPKILTSQDLPRQKLVMFADRLIGKDHAVLCEGPVDAIKAHLCGGNVATMGKAVSRGQMQFLKDRGVKKLYLGLDPDAADEMIRLSKDFPDMEMYYMAVPAKYKDLGEMPMEEVLEIFQAATRLDRSKIFLVLSRK